MTSRHQEFAGRSVIVTGAARGIGEAVMKAFVTAGAYVVAVDRDEDALVRVAEGAGAHPVAADVSSTRDVERAIGAVLDATGRVDVLVNAAGLLRDGVLWKLDDSDWDDVIDVHLGGPFRFVRGCVPHFRAQKFGRVVNVTSFAGIRGNVGQAAYSAGKAGIIGFTKTAAKELARFGVTVNAISPNADTRMIASIPPAKRAEFEAMIPMGRFAAPSEIAPAVTFLASEAAGYITGAVLPVDGGLAI